MKLMRIEFVQKFIDQIRSINSGFKKFEFTKKQKEIIQKIKEYQKAGLKFEESLNKEELNDYSTNYSPLDPIGVVIFKENKVYRAIYEKSKDEFIELLNTGILQVFADYGFIPKFKVTNYFIEDCPIVIEIEKLKIIPACFWNFSMLMEEAKLKLSMLEILREFNYGLRDGHTGNVSFNGKNPIFFDIGSFEKNGNGRWAYEEIFYSNILSLMFFFCDNFYLGDMLVVGFYPKRDFYKSSYFKNAFQACFGF